VLADGRPDATRRPHDHGYTMPAIACELVLHPSTISRRLVRLRAQIKT
jgi:IS30 family transposase